MRIISETTVKTWAQERPEAATSLLSWIMSAKGADWKSLEEVRRTYPHADPVGGYQRQNGNHLQHRRQQVPTCHCYPLQHRHHLHLALHDTCPILEKSMEGKTMTTTTKLHPDYLALVQRFPLRPIRTKRSHDQAMELVCELAPTDEGTLSSGQTDYLDALAVLLEDYDRHENRQGVNTSSLSALDVLKSLMEARDMTVTELGKVIGSQSNASLILAGQRGLSKAVMVKLGDYFGVAPTVFFSL